MTFGGQLALVAFHKRILNWRREGGGGGIGLIPLSSGKGRSLRSKRKAQRSTFGMSSLGYVDSVGIV